MSDKSSNAPGGAPKGDQTQRNRLRDIGCLQACRTASVGSVGRAVCVWPRAWWWSCCANVRQFPFAYDVLEAHGCGYRFRVGLVHRLVLAVVMVAVSAARRPWANDAEVLGRETSRCIWCSVCSSMVLHSGSCRFVEWGSLMNEGRRLASHAETCELGRRRHSRRIKPDRGDLPVSTPYRDRVYFRDTAPRLTRRA